MTVIREVNNVLHVDLSKPLLDSAKDEVPVSIRDALVFLELAQFITPESGNITGEPESGLMGGMVDCCYAITVEPKNYWLLGKKFIL